jgi:GDP-L-fucose synthase
MLDAPITVRDAALYDLRGKRVWVAGHTGMVGSAIVRRLWREGCALLSAPHKALDLKRQEAVEQWFAANRPQAVFLAAARVGGIFANNSRPADFIYDNLAITTNVIEAARKYRVEKLLFLGSSCIYPKFAHQPIHEEELLDGALEPTNEWYAVAKIAGIKLCQSYRRQYGCDFISAMPTNLYGPHDNFDQMSGHVIGGLMSRAHEAKQAGKRDLEVWGTGEARREFLYVDDAADACVHLMKHYSDELQINVGCGEDVTIAELARLVMRVVGLPGEIRFRTEMPDGTPRKLLDVSRLLSLNWSPRVSLEDGLQRAYRAFLQQKSEGDVRCA